MKKNKGKGLPSASTMTAGAGGGIGRLEKAGMLTGGAGKPKGNKTKKNNPGY